MIAMFSCIRGKKGGPLFFNIRLNWFIIIHVRVYLFINSTDGNLLY